MPIIYTAAKGDAVYTDAAIAGPAGSMGFISFRRLIEQLAAAGEFKPGEKVTYLRIALDGIAFCVEQKLDQKP